MAKRKKSKRKKYNNPLIRLRKSHSLTQREVAEMLDVPKTSLSTLEQEGVGGRTYSNLALRVADLFEVEPEVLWPKVAARIEASKVAALDAKCLYEYGATHRRMGEFMKILGTVGQPVVTEAMSLLRPVYKEVLERRYGLAGHRQHTYKEICDTILGGVPPASAQSRIRRALNEIRCHIGLPQTFYRTVDPVMEFAA